MLRCSARSTPFLIAFCLLASSAASAQFVASSSVALRQCFDRVPDTALHESRVFVVEKGDDTLPPPAVAIADSVTRPLTAALRGILGAAPGNLPKAEPSLTWRDLGGTVLLSIKRDGRISLTTPQNGAATGSAGTDTVNRSRPKSIVFLEQAFDSLMKDKSFRVEWPRDFASDSVVIQLMYHVAHIDSLGYMQPTTFHILFPAFKMRTPEETPARARKPITLRYPSGAYRESAEGKTTLIFVVDENGKAIPETIHDNWPPNRPRQTGALGKAYDALVESARKAILSAEFIPASIGGCAVRQRVAQPFEFYIH